jgi:16S rRNA pseudouridine516 synthase
MGNRKDTLADLLHDQGFGTRRDCRRLILDGLVEIGAAGEGGVAWRKAEDPEEAVTPTGLHFKVQGQILPYRESLNIAFHKPVDTECSRAPGHYRSVFSFFPEAFLRRDLQAVGRLDADTTGLLLFTDSGDLNHFLTSPKRHVPKTYRVETRHPIAADQVERLRAGVELRSEDGPTLPARVEMLGDKVCLLTIAEGKYHQVKRMFAAVGNRVEKIHRVAIGGLKLDDALAPGAWRFLEPEDLRALGYSPK